MQIEFTVGDKVLLDIKHLSLKGVHKFKQRYIGPLEVIEPIGTQVYCLKLPQVLAQHHDVFHVSSLHTYVARGKDIKIHQSIKILGELKCEVERNLHHRKKHNSSALQYLVKYLGYNLSDATWLDKNELHNAPNVLRAKKAT